MGKLLFFAIIAGAIYFMFFKKDKVTNESKDNTKNDKDLIMCDKCKTFVSEDEIIKVNGKNICKDCYDNS